MKDYDASGRPGGNRKQRRRLRALMRKAGYVPPLPERYADAYEVPSGLATATAIAGWAAAAFFAAVVALEALR